MPRRPTSGQRFRGNSPPARALPGIATRTRLGFGIRVFAKSPQGLAGEFIQPGVTVFQLREQLLTHAPRPETFDVIFNAGDRVVTIRLGSKEVADVVRHLH
jgi:hypothetical protein